jgi:hypothetical protein
MYIKYIQGFSQSRLNTADYAIFLVASATTALFTPLFYLSSLCSVLLSVSSYNSAARTPQKTPSSIIKNACLLVRYLAMNVQFLRA